MKLKLPSRKEMLTMLICIVVWIFVTALFVGIRPEHVLIAGFSVILFCLNKTTREFIVAMMPFIVFGISYDWMNILPNYKVNSIDIKELYDAEKSFFGIAASSSRILTPNEFFALHNCSIADFLAGVFYLCWVPVPIMFGIGLFFTRQRREYLHFSLVFLFVNLIGFAVYYIHPAAPPWFAAHYGFEPIFGINGEVAGLGKFDDMIGLNIFHALYSRNSNVYAALPSLHASYMLIAFVYSLRSRCNNLLRILFAIIMCGIWFTAVYTSHHYVIDVIAGIICALLGIFVFEKCLIKSKKFAGFLERYEKYIS